MIALVVFIGVEGALLYSLLKFRARSGAVAAQIRGNTRLEIGWTVGAAVILVALAVITFAKLAGIRTPDNSGPDGLKLADGVLVAASPQRRLPPNGKSLNVCVNGQQYVWRYTYQPDCSADPLEVTVLLHRDGRAGRHDRHPRHHRPGRRALVVDPQARRQVRRDPRLHQPHVVQDPGRPGGHDLQRPVRRALRAQPRRHGRAVRAVTPAEFEAWLAERKSDIEAADKAAQEQRKEFEGTDSEDSKTTTTP